LTRDLYVSYGGSCTLSGGSLSVSDGEYVGYKSAGAFTQSGGTHETPSLVLGENAGASGSYTLSGGSHTVSDTLTLAVNSGSTGTYNLSGGSLTAGSILVNSGGAFTQTGGSLVAPATLIRGGAYNLQGGSLTTSIMVNANGIFNQTGGSLDAPIILAGGTLTAGTINGLGGQTLTIGSGTLGANAAGVSLDNALTIIGNFNLGGSAGASLNLTQTLNLDTHTLTHTVRCSPASGRGPLTRPGSAAWRSNRRSR